MSQLFYLPFRPVFNSRGLPVGGAKVFFYKTGTTTLAPVYADSALATPRTNPVPADGMGQLPDIYLAEDQVYRVRIVDRSGLGLGTDIDPYHPGQALKGETGPANSTYPDLAALKAADPTNLSFILTTATGPITYAYVVGNFTGADDEVNVVKLNGTPLATGALVRQSSRSLTYQQDGAGSVPRSAQAKASDFINALDKGVLADGSTDDRIAMQAAIDLASGVGRPLQLPNGTIMIGAPGLDLRGRAIDMRGVPNRTTIKARATMALLINAEEAADTYYTPFNLQDVFLDGDNKVTNANLSIRFRHGYDLSSVWSFNAFRAFRERDCYLSRHWNLRTGICQIGFHVEGSNHSSSYMACSAVGAAAAGILIEALGAEPDGNHALTFTGCDVEFGDGYGVIISANTSANFEGCYLGEQIGKSVVYNTGGVARINGGIMFWGLTPESYLAQPVGGQTIFNGSRLAAQTNGSIATMAFATDVQIAAGTGKVRFEDINGYVPVGGDPVLSGDLLDHGPQRSVFAPRWGRVFGVENGDTTVTTDVGAGGEPNTQRVTCTSVTGANPRFGLFSPLINTFWRTGRPMYLVLVYRASKAVTVRCATDPLGTLLFNIGSAPAAATTKTFVKLDPMPGNAASGVLEFFIQGAAAGDFFELAEVYFADSTMHKQNTGDLGALYKC